MVEFLYYIKPSVRVSNTIGISNIKNRNPQPQEEITIDNQIAFEIAAFVQEGIRKAEDP